MESVFGSQPSEFEYVTPELSTFNTVSFDKQGGIALSSITYYSDKIYIFRVNGTYLKVLVSDLTNEGLTHLNNTLVILNKNNYQYIQYNRGMANFIVFYSESNEVVYISDLTQEQNTTLSLAGAYFMNLLNN